MEPNRLPHLQVDQVLRALKEGCCARYGDDSWIIYNEHDEPAGTTTGRTISDLRTSGLAELRGFHVVLTEKGHTL